ncbi:RNA polymerase II transcriptional coactivator KIWI-like [Impatiens glandulifera]|uniref:RNA polymerase II transcriptional coactivator KIWI-like n=1 Tax=Impatiens glandulifera TaxID=253017 RepID=UPI001FB070AA|nr:RNA polymerase II transcriptional coactivator KIWI-like [Impatiens glandulifera]XP_047318431.1 RNA polymerase II transcriptional coactivator KIWI-like [Impatiens glandulifera]
MSKWGKRKEKDYGSEGGAPARKAPRKDSVDESDEDTIVACEISNTRRVSVRNWQGNVMVDIREFYLKDGKKLPGKKGISLSMDQWNVLRQHIDEIDKAVGDKS